VCVWCVCVGVCVCVVCVCVCGGVGMWVTCYFIYIAFVVCPPSLTAASHVGYCSRLWLSGLLLPQSAAS